MISLRTLGMVKILFILPCVAFHYPRCPEDMFINTVSTSLFEIASGHRIKWSGFSLSKDVDDVSDQFFQALCLVSFFLGRYLFFGRFKSSLLTQWPDFIHTECGHTSSL